VQVAVIPYSRKVSGHDIYSYVYIDIDNFTIGNNLENYFFRQLQAYSYTLAYQYSKFYSSSTDIEW